MRSLPKFTKQKNRNLFQLDYCEYIENAIEKLGEEAPHLDELSAFEEQIGSPALLSPAYFLWGLDLLCEAYPDHSNNLEKKRLEFIRECLPQVRIIAGACDNDTWYLLEQYCEGELSPSDLIEHIDLYRDLLPNHFFNDFIKNLKNTIALFEAHEAWEKLLAALNQYYSAEIPVKAPYTGPYFSLPKLTEDLKITKTTVLKSFLHYGPSLLFKAAAIEGITRAASTVAVAAAQNVPNSSVITTPNNASFAKELHRLEERIRDQVALSAVTRTTEFNAIKDQPSFFDQAEIVSNEQKTVQETLEKIVHEGFQMEANRETAAASETGRFEKLMERSNQGDAKASERLAEEHFHIGKFDVNKNLVFKKFFYARALLQSSSINPRLLKKLMTCIIQQIYLIDKNHLAGVTDTFQLERLQNYEKHYAEFQKLHEEYKKLLSGFSDLKFFKQENDKFRDQVAAIPSPADLRDDGIAVPPVCDPKKAKFKIHLELLESNPNIHIIEHLVEQYMLPDFKSENSNRLPTNLLKKTRAWLDRLVELGRRPLIDVYFERAMTKGDIAALLKLGVSCAKTTRLTGDDESTRTQLVMEWAKEAAKRGSVLGICMYGKMAYTFFPSEVNEAMIYVKKPAALGYDLASALVGVMGSKYQSNPRKHPFFHQQAAFQETGGSIPVSGSPYEWPVRLVFSALLIILFRSVRPTLVFGATEIIGKATDYQWALRGIFLLHLAIFYRPERLSFGRINAQNSEGLLREYNELTTEENELQAQIKKVIAEKCEFLNALINGQRGNTARWKAEKKYFYLETPQKFVVYKYAPNREAKFPKHEFLRILNTLFAPFINDISLDEKEGNLILRFPCKTNLGEWPALLDMQKKFCQALSVLHESMLATEIQQTHEKRNSILADCEKFLFPQAVQERHKLWEKVAEYQKQVEHVKGQGKTKAAVKQLRTTIQIIETLTDQFNKEYEHLKNLPQSDLNRPELVGDLNMNLDKTLQKLEEYIQSVSKGFDALSTETLFSENEKKPAHAKTQKPAQAPKPPTKSQNDANPNKFFKKPKEEPASSAPVVAAPPKVTHIKKPVAKFSVIEREVEISTEPGFEGMIKLPPKVSNTAPLRKQNKKVTATPLTPSTSGIVVQDHCDHISSLLSNENPYRDNKTLLCRGLHYHLQRIFMAFCENPIEEHTNSVYKDLLEGLSHAYFIALGKPDLLIDFCKEFSDPHRLIETERLKESNLYQEYWRQTGFNSEKYRRDIDEYAEHLQQEFSLLKECQLIFRKEKQPTFATHYHSAAKGCLTLMGECAARLFEISEAHRYAALWSSIESYRQNLDGRINVENVQKKCQALIENIELIEPQMSPPHFAALKIQLSGIISNCERNKEYVPQALKKLLGTLDKLTETNERFSALLRTVVALNICRYAARNRIKHDFDAESLEIFAQNNLTVAVEELNVQQVLDLTRLTCVEVDIKVFADFIRLAAQPISEMVMRK